VSAIDGMHESLAAATEEQPAARAALAAALAAGPAHAYALIGPAGSGKRAVARAFAATDDRDYVTPDDVKAVAAPVVTHRMALTAEAELRGVRVENVLADIIDDIPVPRSRET